MGKAPPINNNKYKSKTCTTFNDKLFCPYGQRCLFKHEARPYDDVKQMHYVYKLLTASVGQYFSNHNSNGGKRLKVFQTIT